MDFVFPEPEPEQEFSDYLSSMDEMATNDKFLDEISETVIGILKMPANEITRIYLAAYEGESADKFDFEIVKGFIFLGLIKLMEEVTIDRALADGRMEYMGDQNDNPDVEDDDDECDE